ncbi:bifunctional DNA-formamidopyrimidine glycosylase/DNA-(apurinic or apyrimidinic site) lyase [Legionella gresilensis]|uniref:bifunctional DNA-formamidopyrimidine glycosylase/DNA-(apurinic or apyrimidinic site) lyase n=1 Tax=Legionella gresilensis TaxID=91823 RepID=UPI0010412238|nr:bifunctional DNA-formamidopyrimidine glycosylase/DNA-(apurinic or apyrimidinic site) lyase [Legionella gresilensis]
MPELPEVETTRLAISPYLTNQIITRVIIRNSQLRLPVSVALSDVCPGQKIEAVDRRAKYLILKLSKGYILIHLGMSGHLRLVNESMPLEKHDHIELTLQNGLIIRYQDPRRFGLWLYLTSDPANHKLLNHLGPEPLTDNFNANYLFKRCQGKKQSIKSFLMDNQIVVGIGNIYATESLFLAGIHPFESAGNLTIEQLTKLVDYAKRVLQEAIDCGGTTLRDFYSLGNPGYFINQLKVYGRKGQTCFECKTILESLKIAGRTSTYCPKCQPLKQN